MNYLLKVIAIFSYYRFYKLRKIFLFDTLRQKISILLKLVIEKIFL